MYEKWHIAISPIKHICTDLGVTQYKGGDIEGEKVFVALVPHSWRSGVMINFFIHFVYPTSRISNFTLNAFSFEK